MPPVVPQPPFLQVRSWQQPFGIRVRCVLGLPVPAKTGLVTGAAIEATGGMQAYFGAGPFSRGQIRGPTLALAEILSLLDKHGGTTLLYWGTGNTESFQSLGFRTPDQWRTHPFPPPRMFGRSGCLLPAIRYFIEGTHPATGHFFAEEGRRLGVFVFILDGAIEDFPAVRDYCLQLAEQIETGRRPPARLVLVGFGQQYIEQDGGQARALAAHFARMNTPVVVSVVADDLASTPRVASEVIMTNQVVAETGCVFDADGRAIRHFPTGLPGTIEFLLPSDSTAFSVSVGGQVYRQELF